MKNTELRLGNILNGGIVVEITKKYFTVDDGNAQWRSILMREDWVNEQPVELTEKWLLNMGFIKDGEYFKKYLGTFCFGVRKYDFFTPYTPFTKLKYVHQLQNLYFNLTNNELECDGFFNKLIK